MTVADFLAGVLIGAFVTWVCISAVRAWIGRRPRTMQPDGWDPLAGRHHRFRVAPAGQPARHSPACWCRGGPQ